MQPITLLIEQLYQMNTVGKNGVKIYPNTTASEDQILAWQKRTGYLLPVDYAEFLKRIGECKLHGSSSDKDYEYSVKFFALPQIDKFSLMAYGNISSEIPNSWFAVADVHEGNYIIMDLSCDQDEGVKVIDGHSIIAHLEAPIIAKSFAEFLQHSIDDPNTSSGGGDLSEGRRYWSKPG